MRRPIDFIFRAYPVRTLLSSNSSFGRSIFFAHYYCFHYDGSTFCLISAQLARTSIELLSFAEDASRHLNIPKPPKQSPAFICAQSPSSRGSAKKKKNN